MGVRAFLSTLQQNSESKRDSPQVRRRVWWSGLAFERAFLPSALLGPHNGAPKSLNRREEAPKAPVQPFCICSALGWKRMRGLGLRVPHGNLVWTEQFFKTVCPWHVGCTIPSAPKTLSTARPYTLNRAARKPYPVPKPKPRP